MKRLYETYFHVPEEGKIKEKVFVCRIAVAIVCMVCCLSAMGFSAYAYFTSNVTSTANTIQAATYSAEIRVEDASSKEALLATEAEGMTYTYHLSAGKAYTVTIQAGGNAKTGYCKIVIGEEEKTYFTVPVIPNSEALTFAIECYEEGKQVCFITNWGSSSVTDVKELVGMDEANIKTITIGNPTETMQLSDEALPESNQESDDQVTQTTDGTTENQVQTPTASEETDNAESSDVGGGTTPENPSEEPTKEPTEESADGAANEENGDGADTTVPGEDTSE